MTRPRLPPPDPPFVELGFYAEDRVDADLFQDVLDALAQVGGVANGRAFVLPASASSGAFAGPGDHALVEVAWGDLSEVSRSRPEGRVVAVEVAGALRYDRRHAARVTYLRIDPVRSRPDRHPVAVWATGELFSGPAQKRTQAAGRELRRLFGSMVDAVRPSYAAVTVDWALGTPEEIATDPKAAGDHRDIFLGSAFVGSAALDEVEAAAAGLDVERGPAGLFSWSSPSFGGTGLDHRPAGSAFVRAIARRGRQGPAAP